MLAADTLASYGSLAMFKDVQRISKTGSYTLVGASGEMSDYHAILRKLEGLERDNLNANDGFEHSPVEIYSYLRAVMYQARNKFNPLWNSLVVGGYKDGKAFLGSVDLRGTAYEDDVIATGFGAHLALPIMRAKWHADLDEGEARALLEDCLRVLFYRDCRALDMVVLSKATADGTLVSDPYKIETDWSSASFVVPKAGEDGDGGWGRARVPRPPHPTRRDPPKRSPYLVHGALGDVLELGELEAVELGEHVVLLRRRLDPGRLPLDVGGAREDVVGPAVHGEALRVDLHAVRLVAVRAVLDGREERRDCELRDRGRARQVREEALEVVEGEAPVDGEPVGELRPEEGLRLGRGPEDRVEQELERVLDVERGHGVVARVLDALLPPLGDLLDLQEQVVHRLLVEPGPRERRERRRPRRRVLGDDPLVVAHERDDDVLERHEVALDRVRVGRRKHRGDALGVA